MAERILSGLGLGMRAYFRAPAYFYLLAFWEWIARGSLLAPRLFQAVLDAVSCALASVFAYRLTKKLWAGSISGLILSCYWLNVYFSGELLITTCACFFNLLALYFLTFYVDENWKKSACAGALVGIASLFRPNILLFALAVVFYWILKKRAKSAIAFLVLIILFIMPVFLRNLIVAKDPLPLASQAGINFWIGNNRDADGRCVILPLYRRNLDGKFLARVGDDPWSDEIVWLVALYIAEKNTGRELKESEVNAYWVRQSLKEIFQNPSAWIKLFLKKVYYLLNKKEVSNNRDIEYHAEKISILRILAHFHLGLFLPIGLLGFFIGFSNKKLRYLQLYFVFYGLSVVLFFVISRYRMPLIFALAIFAGVGIERFFGYIWQRNWGKVGACMFILLVFFWLGNVQLVDWNDRPLRSALRYNLGLAYLKKGNYDQAIFELKQAIKIKRKYPEAHLALANAYALKKDYAFAVYYYELALSYDPNYAEAHYNYGLTLLAMNKPDRAYEHLLQAHLLKPEIFPAPEEVLKKLLERKVKSKPAQTPQP